jgi:hypothetical protein
MSPALESPAKGTSSTGRASVSKTEGWGFKSLVPCKVDDEVGIDEER